MKKANFLTLGLAALMGLFLLNSCEKEQKAPTISLIAEAGFISADATVEPGDSVKIKVTITEGDGSVSKFDFTREGTSLSGYPKTEAIEAGTNVFATEAPNNAGVYKYEITVTDKNDLTASVSVNITVAAGGGAISTWSGKVLGAGGNATLGSYFASSTGTVYLKAAAQTNVASVDIVYDYTTSAQFASPSTSTLTSATITNFSTSTITATEFDAMTDDASISSLAPSGTSVTGLAANSVYSFKNAAGKIGLIKVVSISGTTAGSITIDVKVQQ